RAEINRAAQNEPEAFVALEDAPLLALRKLLAESHIALPDALPPMAAGVFGYLGYDVVRLIEDLPPPRQDRIGIPDAVLVRPTLIRVSDGVKDPTPTATPVRSRQAWPAQTALAQAIERLWAVAHALDQPLDKTNEATSEALHAKPASNTTPADFKRMV